MVDIDLLVHALRARGHAVAHVEKLPENAGEFQFNIDGVNLNLDEARALLEQDQATDRTTSTDVITDRRT